MLEEITGQKPVPLTAVQGDAPLPAPVPSANEATETPGAGTDAAHTAPDTLPDDAPQRTREQFEKLKEKNRQLAEQLRQSQLPPAPKRPSVLESIMPRAEAPAVPLSGPQVPPLPQGYGYEPPRPPQPQQFANVSQQEYNQLIQGSIDPRDGQLDVNVLTQRLAQRDAQNAGAAQRAVHAERQAQEALSRVEQFEVTQQAQVLHAAYPELDPDSSVFDPEAYDLVKKDLLDQIVQTGKQDALGAAKRMSKYFRKPSAQTPEQVALQSAHAAATTQIGTGTKPAYASDQEFEDLKARSRYDKGALADRLKRSGY